MLAILAITVSGCGGGGTATGGVGGGGGGGTVTTNDRWNALDAAGAKFESLKALPTAQRHAQMLTYLRTVPVIEQVGESNSANIWARFKDGRIALFLDNRIKTGPFHLTGHRPRVVNELPLAKTAFSLNALDKGWKSLASTYETWLNNAGYTVNPGQKCRLSDLDKVKNAGVFFWSTHGGVGQDRAGNPVFGLWSASVASRDFDDTATYKPYWDNGWICVAFADGDQADGSVKGEWHYAVTPKYVRERMTFSNDSLVVIGACSSGQAEVRDAFFAAGAACYVGWSVPVSSDGAKDEQMLFDQLLGENVVAPPNPNQRPFDILRVKTWLAANGYTKDPGGPATMSIDFDTANGTFGLLNPSISRMYVHESENSGPDTMTIEGDFGTDPGDRSVTVDNVAQVIESWTPTVITIDIPRTGTGSCGDVQVIAKGHKSNVAQLTEWRGIFTYTLTGKGSLSHVAKLNVHFRGDISKYRNLPGVAPQGITKAMISARDSSGTYASSGIYQPTPSQFTKWSGSGNLVAKDPSSQAYLKTMVFAGNLDSNALSFTGVFAVFAPYVRTNESGSVNLLFGTDGITLITIKFDSAYNIKADSVTGTTADGAAKLSWPTISPRFPPVDSGGRVRG